MSCFKKMFFIALMFVVLFMSCDGAIQSFFTNLFNQHKKIKNGEPVSAEIVTAASKNKRFNTYAKTHNPVNNITYEFMISESGYVIYREDAGEWKYFGTAAMDYNALRNGQNITLGKVEMISADGNRVFVKEKEKNNFFFSVMTYDEMLDVNDDGIKDPTGGIFITKDPEWILPKPKSLTETIKKNHPGWGNAIEMPGALVVSADKPFTWYKLNPGFDKPNEEVIDIANIDIHREQGGYQEGYGGDYHRPLPDETEVKLLVDDMIDYFLENEGDEEFLEILTDAVTKIASDSVPATEIENQIDSTFSGGSDLTIENAVVKEAIKEIAELKVKPPIRDLLNAVVRYTRPVIEANGHYGTFCDGISNFYVLTRRKENSSYKYHVYYIDEQTYYSGNWGAGYLLVALLGREFIQNPDIERGLDIANKIDGKFSGTWHLVGDERPHPFFSAQEIAIYNVIEPRDIEEANLLPWRPGDDSNPNIHWWDWYDIPYDVNENVCFSASIENIVVNAGNRIYSLNWTFGSMDFTWRVRNKPSGSHTSNIMINRDMTIFIPGTKENIKGYYIQSLIPDNGFSQIPAPNASEVHFGHENNWSFVPAAEASMTNYQYDF